MAWTNPSLVTPQQTFTAAWFNTYIRDNMLETEVAKATLPDTVGGWFVANGSHVIENRPIKTASTSTSTSITSTTFTVAPDGNGPEILLNTGARAIVFLTMMGSHATVGQAVKMSLSPVGSVVPGDSTGLTIVSSTANAPYRYTIPIFVSGMTPGVHSFLAVYRVTSGTGTINHRAITVISL